MKCDDLLLQLYEAQLSDQGLNNKPCYFADELEAGDICVFKEGFNKMEVSTSSHLVVPQKGKRLNAYNVAALDSENGLKFYIHINHYLAIFTDLSKYYKDRAYTEKLFDLSCLKTSTRRASLINGEIVLSSIRMSPDKSKLQSLRDNKGVFFLYDNKEHILHDKTCSVIDSKPLADFSVYEGYLMDVAYCEKCSLKLHIRMAVGDDFKRCDSYIAFLKRGGLSEADIKQLTGYSNFSMRFLGPNCLQVKVNEDTWKIEKQGKKYYLYHNNYYFLNKTDRMLPSNCGEFHRQCVRNGLYPIMDRICKYSFDDHVQWANRKKPLRNKIKKEIAGFRKGCLKSLGCQAAVL